jgi:predicted small secreted protein
MKKLSYILLVILSLSLAGCARTCETWNRDMQMTDRYYHIEVYSGGQLIRTYDFKGILNNQTNSDGYYFTVGDTLHEVGGDIIIKSW